MKLIVQIVSIRTGDEGYEITKSALLHDPPLSVHVFDLIEELIVYILQVIKIRNWIRHWMHWSGYIKAVHGYLKCYN